MRPAMRHLYIPLMLAAIIAGCSSRPAPAPQPAPLPMAPPASDYVAPQSAPVLPPSYPPLGGAAIQSAGGWIPLTQGR